MTKKDLINIKDESVYYQNRECKVINQDSEKYIIILWLDTNEQEKVNTNDFLKNIRKPKNVKENKITKKELKELIDTEIHINGRLCIIKSIDDKENLIRIHWLDNNRVSSRLLEPFIKEFNKLKNKKVKQKKENVILEEEKYNKLISSFEENVKYKKINIKLKKEQFNNIDLNKDILNDIIFSVDDDKTIL